MTKRTQRCYCNLVRNVVYDNFQDILVPESDSYSALGNTTSPYISTVHSCNLNNKSLVTTTFLVLGCACCLMGRIWQLQHAMNHWFFLVERNVWSTPKWVWWHILNDYQVCDWGIQYHLSSTHGRLWALVVVGLSWLSGRALVTQARGVLGEIPRECWPFLYFLLFRFILIPLHDVMLTQVSLACQHDSTKFRT